MAFLRNVMMERQQDDRRIANVLAIGTANPSNIYYQADYPDFYFKVTNSQHMTDLKAKFQHSCKKSGIKKRHMHLNEEILRKNPNLAIYGAASLNSRQDILAEEVPKLGKEAALKAIKEWGQPMSRITHLIFVTSTGVDLPGADIRLVRLLGLSHTIQRYMMYNQGCNGSTTALRLAKDVAEKNVGSRVLIVCSELMSLWSFHAPSDTHFGQLFAFTNFADGAVAVIVGADPVTTYDYERPLFQIVAAHLRLVPDSEHNVMAKTRETGLEFYFSNETLKIVEKYTKQCVLAMLEAAFCSSSLTLTNEQWNELFFYVVHPGASTILRAVELSLNLAGDKLKASREVLSEYGSMVSSTSLFALDEMRKKSKEEGKTTSGEGLDWGVLIAFGLGFTVETVLLRSYAYTEENGPSRARL